MLCGVVVLGLAAVGAFRAATQVNTRRETSEVIRLLSDREITGFQILWSVIGVVSAGFAVFLLVRACRLVVARGHQNVP
jgi:hypothetical protein